MDEESFQQEIRKFLKRFGVTAQRAIERAVKDAIDAGTLRGEETIVARATLELEGVLPPTVIEGEIALAAPTDPARGERS